MAARHLVEDGPEELTDDDIREAISGNLCRCTGYVNVVAAIRLAAARRPRP
jgi:aerobic-type carbon monoxide dehydrogenase small subunit (CoxS/CutS family)